MITNIEALNQLPYFQSTLQVIPKFGIHFLLFNYGVPEKGTYLIMSVADDLKDPKDLDPIKMLEERGKYPFMTYPHSTIIKIDDLSETEFHTIVCNRIRHMEVLKNAYMGNKVPERMPSALMEGIEHAYLKGYDPNLKQGTKDYFKRQLRHLKKDVKNYEKDKSNWRMYQVSGKYHPGKSKFYNYIKFLFKKDDNEISPEQMAINYECIKNINIPYEQYEKMKETLNQTKDIVYWVQQGYKTDLNTRLPERSLNENIYKGERTEFQPVRLVYPECYSQRIIQIMNQCVYKDHYQDDLKHVIENNPVSTLEIPELMFKSFTGFCQQNNIYYSIDDGILNYLIPERIPIVIHSYDSAKVNQFIQNIALDDEDFHLEPGKLCFQATWIGDTRHVNRDITKSKEFSTKFNKILEEKKREIKNQKGNVTAIEKTVKEYLTNEQKVNLEPVFENCPVEQKEYISRDIDDYEDISYSNYEDEYEDI